jgi:hypothetical protein
LRGIKEVKLFSNFFSKGLSFCTKKGDNTFVGGAGCPFSEDLTMTNEFGKGFGAFTTAELIAFYNERVSAEKQVKRFSDRATAIKRCTDLLESMAVSVESEECPHCGVHLSNGVIEAGGETADGEMIRLELQFECMACGEEFGPAAHPDFRPKKSRSSSTAHSEGVARSWEDDVVRAKRRARHAVEVDGIRHGSVNKAFIALGLPSKECIAFRAILKANGSEKAYGMAWKAIPLSEESE